MLTKGREEKDVEIALRKEKPVDTNETGDMLVGGFSSCAAPALVVEYIATSVSYVTLAQVDEYFTPAPTVDPAPAPVVEFFSPAPVTHAAPAPVVEYIAPAPAGHAAPAPVVEYTAPAPQAEHLHLTTVSVTTLLRITSLRKRDLRRVFPRICSRGLSVA